MEDKYDSAHYNNWRETRNKVIVDYFGVDFFQNKTMLEIGAAWGHNGEYYQSLGANVTSTDHYDKWVEIIKERHPQLKARVYNVLEDWPFDENFDIILHMGVLYHLPPDGVEKTITECCHHCNYIILETAVDSSSSDENKITRVPQPPKKDSWEEIMTDYCMPTKEYIERIISKNNFKFKAIPCMPNRYIWVCERIKNER